MRSASAIALPLAIAATIIWVQAWHGPIILSLSAGHGLDTGDLLAVPFAVAAFAAARRRFAPRAAGSAAVAASAIALGVLLLFAGVLPTQGGPLVPAGGGTLDGTIRQTVGDRPMPVSRWTNVALTYDGERERLFVNGVIVSSHAARGSIQAPANPLWIGGNRPYGEHFDGLIDEVRVYNRALAPSEIRADMTSPVRPAPGLVSAYAFDAGSGATATDSSRNGNTGEIRGAAWVRGRFGDALRFDGVATVVRVPPSASLGLTRAMTLSAWVRPSALQSGWRTIVQRQTDAYFLTASSGRLNRYGLVDGVRIALIVVAAGWFCLVIATGRGPRTRARQRVWWLPVALFALGSVADAAFASSGTLIGPALVALWLAATASRRVESASFLLVGGLCVCLTIASVANPADGTLLARNDGGTARTAALGALFLLGGIAARRGTTKIAGQTITAAEPYRGEAHPS